MNLFDVQPASKEWEEAAYWFAMTNETQAALDKYEVDINEYNAYCKKYPMFAKTVKRIRAELILSGENLIYKIGWGRAKLDEFEGCILPDVKIINQGLSRKSPAYSNQEKDAREVNPMIQAWELYLGKEMNK